MQGSKRGAQQLAGLLSVGGERRKNDRRKSAAAEECDEVATSRSRPPNGVSNTNGLGLKLLPHQIGAHARLGSSPDEATLTGHVRFTPERGQIADALASPLCAKSGRRLL
jgi:hypothetical protein